MKAFLEIKKQPVPNYAANGLWKTMRLSAKEHGYRSGLWFGLVRLKDHVLNSWAQTFPWNKARIAMQRWRGVKIGKNVHFGTYVNMDLPYPYFITVEDGVSLAGSITILAHNKPLEYHKNPPGPQAPSRHGPHGRLAAASVADTAPARASWLAPWASP